MKIFTTVARGGCHHLHIAPAHELPLAEAPVEWINQKTLEPLVFTVEFDFNGEATVPDQLGKWLIANGYARKSAIPADQHVTMKVA